MDPKSLDSSVAHFRLELLSWYDQNRRDLPWRQDRDPYRVWVSEIMLQQTRVAAVLPKYHNFLQRFPSVQELAAAREPSVLAEWSGLGYYRRARNLHAAAKIIAKAGKFPQTSAAWLTLPGIGRYTAAAICSIAFNEPVAAVDGNVQRVLRRLNGRNHTTADSWKTAEALLDHTRPGDFNQAMMEFGATVCIPGEPLCVTCPIQSFCSTRGRDHFPPRKPPQQKRNITFALSLLNGSVRLVRRSSRETLMPGMWELPRAPKPARKSALFSLKHSITNTDYDVRVINAATADGVSIKLSRVPQLPLTGLARKILSRAGVI
jgi:A/G-specific adenine glycosylase